MSQPVDFFAGMETQRITVHLGAESRSTTLYKKNNGHFVYWSPFTGERMEISRNQSPVATKFEAAPEEPRAKNVVRLPTRTRQGPHPQLLKLIARDGLKCHWCKRTCDSVPSHHSPMSPTREHVIRKADGGGNSLANLVVACRKCNNARHSKNFDPMTENRKRA